VHILELEPCDLDPAQPEAREQKQERPVLRATPIDRAQDAGRRPTSACGIVAEIVLSR
jgi:hypothetical protein